ncbi:prepilin-type N-terminal cleavage/methylation domain-containing protein [Eikenella sp. S3360]|uniref:Prepilin-type N-terminal cleavage/methylation domain-containing protein n=2 Tax=Eikenella glucosivorans TaxID=2766967 RepID=A0ABS0NCJ5_9NEIS|nr:prepilin-type N-terminal cleavage/methylation domain-containing protein [Eikenella glucosivorans]
MMDKSKIQGFNLIELMISIVILAVLAAMAYPSYDSFVRKARMEEAKARIMDKARSMERFYTVHRTFKDPDSPVSAPVSTDFFNITFVNDSMKSDSYEIIARPSAKNPRETKGIYYNSIGILNRCDIDNDGNTTNCEQY